MAIGSPAEESTTLAGTTYMEVIPAPASGLQHLAMKMTAYNKDTVAHVITVSRYDGTTDFPLESSPSLAAGASHTFEHVEKHIAHLTTTKFRAKSDATATTNEPVVNAAYIVNSP